MRVISVPCVQKAAAKQAEGVGRASARGRGVVMRPGFVHRRFVPPVRKPLSPLAPLAHAVGTTAGGAACDAAAPTPPATVAAAPAAPVAAPTATCTAGFASLRAATSSGYVPQYPVVSPSTLLHAEPPPASADLLPDEYYSVCYCKKSNKVQRHHKGFAVRLSAVDPA